MKKMMIFVFRNYLGGNSISKTDLKNLDGVIMLSHWRYFKDGRHDFGVIPTFCNILAYNEVRTLKCGPLPMLMVSLISNKNTVQYI